MEPHMTGVDLESAQNMARHMNPLSLLDPDSSGIFVHTSALFAYQDVPRSGINSE
jgi:hypothetical protein